MHSSLRCWASLFIIVIAVIGIGVGVWYATTFNSSSSHKFERRSNLLIKETSGTIKLIDANLNELDTKVEEYVYGIGAFDYYLNETIYFGTTKPYDPIKSSSRSHQNLPSETGEWTKTGLAVDFITKKLYVIDSLTEQLHVIDMEGKYSNVIYSDLTECKDIVLNPYDHYMFILQQSSIMKGSMSGTEKLEKIIEQDDLKALTIERHEKIIYFATPNEIKSYDYSSNKKSSVLKVSNVVSLSVSKNELYFVRIDEKSETHRIGYCTIVEESCSDLEFLYTNSDVSDVRVFDVNEHGQQKHQCLVGNTGCDHLCLLRPGSKDFACACNKGWQLKDDAKTCVRK